MLASAPLLPKFVSECAAMDHELRKRALGAFILPHLPRIGVVADDHDLGLAGGKRKTLRSASARAGGLVGVGLVGVGLLGFAENAQAQQPYPPYGAQPGYNPYRPG